MTGDEDATKTVTGDNQPSADARSNGPAPPLSILAAREIAHRAPQLRRSTPTHPHPAPQPPPSAKAAGAAPTPRAL